MRPECIEILKNYIIQALIRHASNNSYNIFDGLVQLMQTNWDASPTTMLELRQNKKTKDKGDLLEHFAYLYFKHVYRINKEKAAEVYLLKDAPDDVLKELNLKRYDMGIDLLVRFDPGHTASKKAVVWCAVQVKYRQPNPYKQTFGVSWSDLSTFYALVNRSGPYRKHIVLTNSHYVRHIGKKEFKDQSICIGTLRNITKDEWVLMANLTSNLANQTKATSITEPSLVVVESEIVCSKKETEASSTTTTNCSISTNSMTTSTSTSAVIDSATSIKPLIVRKKLPIISIRPRLSPIIKKVTSTDATSEPTVETTATTIICPKELPKKLNRPTIEELREIRCAFYDRMSTPSNPQD